MSKPNVFLACSGVGHINRGYESFTKECFAALSGNEMFELYLLKGGGISTNYEIKVSCIQRGSRTASWLSKLFKTEAYWIEQLTFLVGMIPHIIKYRPSIIYYSDFILGTFLFHLRRFFNLKYKLLFSNGAPNGPPFKTEDHVQQLLPLYIDQAKKGGTPIDKMTLLPYAINIIKDENVKRSEQVLLMREKLQLPLDKKIIISVGAINAHHKRMDYVVEEFSKLNQDTYFLLILGQIDDKSLPIIKLAERKLNRYSYLFEQVNSEEVPLYMAASNYFILASLSEGLPRVLPEALSNGLTPIVHDYNVTRQTLAQYGIFKDLTRQGVLLEAIEEVNHKNNTKANIINFAWETYSWERLTGEYLHLISKLLD